MNSNSGLSLVSRRQMLRTFANGFGMVALAGLLADEASAEPASSNPLLVKPPQYPAKAKRIIFLFMSGGPSHVDLFDPKPLLDRGSGLPLSRSSKGFGSKRSTCEGPPDMKRKMMRLAFAGYCGGFTSNGLDEAGSAEASSASKPARATMPKPLAKVRSIWRRLTRDSPEFEFMVGCTNYLSININELIEAQQDLCIFFPCSQFHRTSAGTGVAGFAQQ